MTAYVRSLDLAARIAIAFAGAMLVASAAMFAMSTAGIAWNRPILIAILLLWSASALAGARARGGRNPLGILIICALVAYAALTARETCSDLLFFWGPKGIHFWLAKSIDVAYLHNPVNWLEHPDYPPLVPLTYACVATIRGSFSWMAPLVLMPLMFAATVFAFRGIAARAIGERTANLYALLLACILAYASAIGAIAGAGDMPLVMLETIAVAALTFAPRDRGALLVASLMLAAAAFTKVEGAAFAIVIIAAYFIVTRRIVSTLALSAAPAILLGAWLLFCRHHGLLDSYVPRERAHFEILPSVAQMVAQMASYKMFFLPWLAALAPIPFGARNVHRGMLPLLVAAGTLAATLFFYLHLPNPKFWIFASAYRVLLTPLMSLAVASAAMSE